MQVSSLIPDDSVCGKRVPSAASLGSRGEANTFSHTCISPQPEAERVCEEAEAPQPASLCSLISDPKWLPTLGACDGKVRDKESKDSC